MRNTAFQVHQLALLLRVTTEGIFKESSSEPSRRPKRQEESIAFSSGKIW